MRRNLGISTYQPIRSRQKGQSRGAGFFKSIGKSFKPLLHKGIDYFKPKLKSSIKNYAKNKILEGGEILSNFMLQKPKNGGKKKVVKKGGKGPKKGGKEPKKGGKGPKKGGKGVKKGGKGAKNVGKGTKNGGKKVKKGGKETKKGGKGVKKGGKSSKKGGTSAKKGGTIPKKRGKEEGKKRGGGGRGTGGRGREMKSIKIRNNDLPSIL